jgi:L-ribulose-5-phosphate 3-epimerase
VSERIGFMQGRLSPMVGGRIQAFPWEQWREEFPRAAALGIRLMEWTLDQQRLYENPLLTVQGQAEIRTLCESHRLAIPSLTGDCFMQAPFWKAEGERRDELLRDFRAIADACSATGIGIIVVPLVDNGRIESRAQEDALVRGLELLSEQLEQQGLRVVFESDFAPPELRRFIERLDSRTFGINYDMGNSAALDFDASSEIAAYGERILNVHVKDRLRGGTTVALGTGNTDFDAVFAALGRSSFRGNYILQTARAADGDHAGVLKRYRDMTVEWMQRHGA